MQMLCSPLECGSTRNSFLNVKSGVLPSGCGCRVVKLNNMTSDEENKCRYIFTYACTNSGADPNRNPIPC